MGDIGVKIKLLREEKGMSAQDLAKAIGRKGKNPGQGIYDIEKGKIKTVKIPDLHKIAKVLSVDISTFFDSLEPQTRDHLSTFNESRMEYKAKQENLTLEQKYIAALEEIIRLKNEVMELRNKLNN